MISLNSEDQALLDEICRRQGVAKKVLDELLTIEENLFDMGRRHGLYERIAGILEKAVRDEELEK